jgi:hypothetical protein
MRMEPDVMEEAGTAFSGAVNGSFSPHRLKESSFVVLPPPTSSYRTGRNAALSVTYSTIFASGRPSLAGSGAIHWPAA